MWFKTGFAELNSPHLDPTPYTNIEASYAKTNIPIKTLQAYDRGPLKSQCNTDVVQNRICRVELSSSRFRALCEHNSSLDHRSRPHILIPIYLGSEILKKSFKHNNMTRRVPFYPEFPSPNHPAPSSNISVTDSTLLVVGLGSCCYSGASRTLGGHASQGACGWVPSFDCPG
jgi:hypothetical protein